MPAYAGSTWFYSGSMDGWISGITRLGPGSAHVVGMFLTGIITYAIVMAIAWVLDRIALCRYSAWATPSAARSWD